MKKMLKIEEWKLFYSQCKQIMKSATKIRYQNIYNKKLINNKSKLWGKVKPETHLKKYLPIAMLEILQNFHKIKLKEKQ